MKLEKKKKIKRALPNEKRSFGSDDAAVEKTWNLARESNLHLFSPATFPSRDEG